jgi:hypothetical protein
MLTGYNTALEAINKSVSYTSVPGCWIEYNMNDLIDGADIVSSTDVTTSSGDTLPFKKLFPIKSIIDPRRPKTAGIKYFILNSAVNQYPTVYSASSNQTYRLYYPGDKVEYKYWVSKRAIGTSLTGCLLTVSYPVSKTAASNKITIKFETSHTKPNAWTVKIKNLAGVESTISTNAVVPNNGVVDLYYNGSSWSTTKFTTPSSPVGISEIKVEVTSVTTANEYVGIIEIAAKYIKDVTDRIVTFDVRKQSSSSSDGITPVGMVTANSLSIDLNCYDETGFMYDKTFAFNKDKINLYKNIIIEPFITIENSDKIPYGVFYATEEISLSEYGDVSISALDGAGYLQKIMAPDILMRDYSSQAIIRRLLDSVGFTNYNFNTTTTDSSTVTPLFYYTNSTKTMWEHLQDLCNDTQMVAVFDEYDVLQFYTREYLFQNKNAAFKFRYEKIGNNLPNIVDLKKTVVPSAKAVKVRYTPQLTSQYTYSADPVYESGIIKLGAAALTQTLSSSTGPGGSIFTEPVSVYESAVDHVFYQKAGYLLINKEVIEFDAIKYTYKVAGQNLTAEQWITSDIDIAKYQGLSEAGTFKPTGEFRIKQRNAFNLLTAPATHEVNLSAIKSRWTTYVYDKDAKTSTLNNNLITLESTDSQGLKTPRSMLTVNSLITATPTSTSPTKYTISSTTAKTIRSGYSNFVAATSMYFPIAKNSDGTASGNQICVGGIAVCLNEDHTSGYIVHVEPVQSAVARDLKERCVKIIKVVNGVATTLPDSQTDSNQFQNITGGKMYNIQLKVNQTTNGTETYKTFKLMIDNTEIFILDKDPLPTTNRVGLVAGIGTARYDYLYTSPITESEFVTKEVYNPYKSYLGQNSFLVKQFSSFILSKGSVTEEIGYMEEFGPVAREIIKLSARITSGDNAPAIPRYPVITMNPFATIVGSNIDAFTMEAFVINNSGTYTMLSDGETKFFKVIGDSIVKSDSFEYIDPNLTDKEKQEQFAFDSNWIQKESEAKALSEWMKTQWSRQQTIIEMSVFFNPLLQIGDIVEISYPKSELYSSEDSSVPAGYSVGKYVVLDMNHDWVDGPSTKILCRSIYVS